MLMELKSGVTLIGEKYWYKNGKLHREDGPAVINKTIKYWYNDGKLQSVEHDNGYRSLYKDGKFIKTEGERVLNERE